MLRNKIFRKKLSLARKMYRARKKGVWIILILTRRNLCLTGGMTTKQDDIQRLDEDVSGYFVDMLNKLRKIMKRTKGVPSFTDVQ